MEKCAVSRCTPRSSAESCMCVEMTNGSWVAGPDAGVSRARRIQPQPPSSEETGPTLPRRRVRHARPTWPTRARRCGWGLWGVERCTRVIVCTLPDRASGGSHLRRGWTRTWRCRVAAAVGPKRAALCLVGGAMDGKARRRRVSAIAEGTSNHPERAARCMQAEPSALSTPPFEVLPCCRGARAGAFSQPAWARGKQRGG
jgi:hypothetical protein